MEKCFVKIIYKKKHPNKRIFFPSKPKEYTSKLTGGDRKHKTRTRIVTVNQRMPRRQMKPTKYFTKQSIKQQLPAKMDHKYGFVSFSV